MSRARAHHLVRCPSWSCRHDGSAPQKYVVNGTEFVISGPKAIAVVDRLISAYESHEHAFVDLPRCWQSHFKRGGSSSFRQFIEYEFVNHRPTGRARLNVKV